MPKQLMAVIVAVSLLFPFVLSAEAGFYGSLSFLPDPTDPSGRTKLLGENFAFIDGRGVGWEARKGDRTDGASIPPIFWPLVGDNWTFEYLKAAVIHDHYCQRHVRSWRDTHRVFYDALIESGVARNRAAVLYYAILVGGPRWDEKVPGKACSTAAGGSCEWSLSPDIVVMDRKAAYDDPRIGVDVLNYMDTIIASPSTVTAEDVEKAARSRNPGDPFLNNPEASEIKP